MTQLAHLHHSVELRDRTLWYDGTSTMSVKRIADMLLSCKSIDGIFPDEIDGTVRKFNELTGHNLKLKDSIEPFDFSFIIPEHYLNIDLTKYIYSMLLEEVKRDESLTDDDIDKRIGRVNTELALYTQYNITDLLRTTIYMVDEFKKHNVIWGTGRGSSCASYCLYLIGVHEVDSVKYNLELNEFFR